MINSKYLNNVYQGWRITHVGIATVQGAKAKRPYHRGYYFLAERITSDNKCYKQIRLNSSYMRKVSLGLLDIEAYADRLDKKNKKHKTRATQKVNYSFR